MSDVEKTISGLDDGVHFDETANQHQQVISTKAPTELTTKTTGEFDLTTKTSNLKYNPQQQLQQQHQLYQHHQHKPNFHHHQHQQSQQQSVNYYKSITTGSAAIKDSTVAETTALPSSSTSLTTPTPTPTPASASTSATSSCRSNCISRILKLIFSTPGLVLLVVGYSVLGAFIFPLLEAPQDITKSAAIAKSREDCLRELWIITEKLNVLYERNWTMLVHEQLRRFEGSIVAATRNGGAAGMISASPHSTTIGRFGGSVDSWEQARWTFSEALLYSVTVITTIGHGSLTPKTAAGKIATIFYALIGVPLMLMCLSSLGALLAEALQCTYAKVCCRLATHNHGDGATSNCHDGGTSNSHDGGVKRRGHCCKDSNKNSSQRDNQTECHGKGQGLNCKGCKYDAILVENKLPGNYDYNETNSSSNCTLEIGKTDESSRLLHSSPKGRTHHNSHSPCMQLKMMPQQQAAALHQYYNHQQQQQQQKSPQPPDVMLLTTPQLTPLITAETTQAGTRITAATRAIPGHSPQHQHQPQAQQSTTFHIVSNATSPQLISSTHSSPIHYSHHHIPQQQQQQQQQNQQPLQHQLTLRRHLPQHFVAIPSSMIRFQVTPFAAPISSSQLPPNCYQPTTSASAVTASAGASTIYFPIAGSTTTIPRTASTSIGVASTSSQLLCNQPLVKYHTIQLQHKKPTTTSSSMAETSTSSALTTVNILNGEQSKQQQQQQQPESPSTSGSLDNSANDGGTLNVADALPLPPPLAYQTATLHGVRRAKFITTPMPPEINTLLVGSDVSTTSFRHDLSAVEQEAQSMAEQTISTTSSATTQHNGGDNVLLLSTSDGGGGAGGAGGRGCTTASSTTTTLASTPMPAAHNSTTAQVVENLVPAAFAQLAGASTSSTLSNSNVTVDIMEDEEDERMGDCPHGTPSRVPLLSCGNSDRECDKTARSLINAKAAAFNRHTFQRCNNNRLNRKSTLVTQHNGGNLQTSAIWMRRSSCGLDPYTETTSDDDEHFALTQFRKGGNLSAAHLNATQDDGCVDIDGGETDDELEPCGNSGGPHVPISIVLLILVCYISLGTVIFALWENWSLVDGAYFCFVTLATIGFGDFLPERTFQGPDVQLFACCAYLLLGLVIVAMSFSILETQLLWKCKRIAVRLRLARD